MAEKELSKELLDIICCPMDKKDLKYDKKKQTLICTHCKFIYPIKDGIPVLLPPDLQEKEDVDKSKKNGWKGKIEREE